MKWTRNRIRGLISQIILEQIDPGKPPKPTPPVVGSPPGVSEADGYNLAGVPGPDYGYIAGRLNGAASAVEDVFIDAERQMSGLDQQSLLDDMEKLINDAYGLAAAFQGLSKE